ncbi:glycoside hydrolase family 28 protein [Puia dinghuensis]|nr:glycoside hydrolase family 28 protein [Puia dinghuensis]
MRFLWTTLIVLAVHTLSAQNYDWNHLPVIQRPIFKNDTVDIKNYGAVAGGITLNTKAIDAAIRDCNSHGGRVVLIPAGLWLTGPIVLRSNVNLHIDRAAILQFTDDKDQYPIVAGNWEGHPAARCQSPISGTDLENIAITGGGIIDGNGDSWRWIAKDRLTESEWKHKVASGGVVTEDGKTWFPSAKSLKGFRTKDAGWLKPGMTPADFEDIRDFLRPNLLVLANCKKVLLDGTTFQNSPAWCLHTLLCEDLTVNDVHVRNPWNAANGDGIDVESCRRVLIANSTFDAGDDGICVKSGRDEEGRKRGRPTEEMIVRNNIVYRAHGGFVIGSEMSGGARNIFVSDCSFIGTDIGLRFKTVRGRGGIVEKIYVKNISMRNIVHQAVFLDMYYFAKPPSIADIYSGAVKEDIPPVSEATPIFRNIHISNIICDGAEEGIFVRGLPETNIRDIQLSDMVLKTDKGAEIIEAQNIGLKNIRLITADTSRPVVYVENSSDLHFDDIQYNAGADLLFSINGNKCANIHVASTDRSKAVHDAAFNYGATNDALK